MMQRYELLLNLQRFSLLCYISSPTLVCDRYLVPTTFLEERVRLFFALILVEFKNTDYLCMVE